MDIIGHWVLTLIFFNSKFYKKKKLSLSLSYIQARLWRLLYLLLTLSNKKIINPLIFLSHFNSRVLSIFAFFLFPFPLFCPSLHVSCSDFSISSFPILTLFTLSLLWACFLNFQFVLHLLFFFCDCVFILCFPFSVWVFVDGFLFCFLLAQLFVLYFASFSFSAICMSSFYFWFGFYVYCFGLKN